MPKNPIREIVQLLSNIDGFIPEGNVRLKNNVINAEISGNIIKNCGIHDYEFESDDKNGEGIYIGTSSKQVSLANT